MSDDTTENRKKGRLPLKICIIAAIVLIALISTTVFFFHLNGDSLDFSGSKILVVPTGSMDGEPQPYDISTIPEDSIIMVHDLSKDQKKDLAVGDVITFHQGRMEIVHRIIEIKTDGTLVTKGDANQTPDPPITLEEVDGKVVGVAPTVGKIVSSIRDFISGSPVLLVIGIILLIIMVYSIVEVVKIIRNKDEKGE